MQYPDLLIENENAICIISLNRPEKYNALNETLIQSLLHIFTNISKDASIRIIILKGEGKHFCAGADLNWMKKTSEQTIENNEREAFSLAYLLQQMDNCNKPIIGLVQGRAMGGALGLIACCDIVIANENTQFSFSEVKLGLIPATISPYILRKIGVSACLHLFLTAELFSANKAKTLGLIHDIQSNETFDHAAIMLAHQLLTYGPQALEHTKQLMNDLMPPINNALILKTAKLLAKIRASKEAKEGINAFLEKRKPNWN